MKATPLHIMTILVLGALTTKPARAAEDPAAVVADELADQALVRAEDRAHVAESLRARLRDMKLAGERVCPTDGAACTLELRAQLRDCIGEARRQGALAGDGEAQQLAAAMLGLATGEGGDPRPAGELVRAALAHRWQPRELADAATELGGFEERSHWRAQAAKMLRACAADGSCSGEQARIAVGVMQQASRRADTDPREARRIVQATLREQLAEQRRVRDRAQTGDGDGTQDRDRAGTQTADRLTREDATEIGRRTAHLLRTRLERQLRLRDTGDGVGIDTAAVMRYRYRRQVEGESRRGGRFGGTESSCTGSGFGQGDGSGGGPRRGGGPGAGDGGGE